MAKKKTDTTSRGVIKGLLQKAWDKVKGKARSERGTKADVEAKERKRIAEKTGRSVKQVKDIEKGKRPGKNLFEPLKRLKRGRKAEDPPKEPKKITRKKERPEKPKKEKPKKKPPEQPPAKPPARRIKVVLSGVIGPYETSSEDDSDAPRQRTVGRARPLILEGEKAAAFFEALDSGDELRAANLAISEYFSGFPGWVKSLSSKPEWEDIEESEAQ